MTDFEKDLSDVLNRHSQENMSNTPDNILAVFLSRCLCAWNEAVLHRERWHDRNARPTVTTKENRHGP